MDRLSRMPVGVAIVVGAVIGLALGIVVSLVTDVPLAPEVGRYLAGWWLALGQGSCVKPSKPPGCGSRSARTRAPFQRQPRLQRAHEGRRFARESSPPTLIGTKWSISVAGAPQWTQTRP
jgi:hypothetical protein